MRGLLTALCVATIAASAWLGIMFVVLHRPGFESGALMSTLFIVQSLVALAVVNGWVAARAWPFLAITGAAGLVWAGARAILVNLNGPHFEGYAVVIGILLTLQGLLTLITSSSKVHQFGN